MSAILKYVIFLFLFSVTVLPAKENLNSTTFRDQEFAQELFQLLYPPELNNSYWGAALYDLKKQELLFTENYNKSVMPASNQKILVTAVALEILGPDFRYQTRFYMDGNKLEEEVFYGDVYIRGMGDPSLTGRFYEGLNSMDVMQDIVDNLFGKYNIQAFEGDIIGDLSFFSERMVDGTWENEDSSYWYAAASDSLNFSENIITYEISVSEKGEIELTLEPDIEYLSFDVRITTDSQMPNRVSYHRDDNKVVHVEGNVRPGESISRRVNVKNPADYFMAAFRKASEKRGINLEKARFRLEENLQIDYDNMHVVHTHFSPPMIEMVDLINKASHNLYADAVLKTLGKLEKNEGSFSAGGQVIEEAFQRWGVNSFGMYVQDGSGLSRRNLVTPRLLIELMIYMRDSMYFDDWLYSLPRAGSEGTLRGSFRDQEVQGRVLAKTGFINKVRALSGYIMIEEEPRYAFVLICNNYLTPTSFINDLQEKFCQAVWDWHFLSVGEE